MSSRSGREPVAPAVDPVISEVETDLLAGVRPVLIETSQFVAGNFQEAFCSPEHIRQVTQAGRRREVRQFWPDRVDRVFTKFVIASAGVIVRDSDGNNEPDFIQDLMKTHFEADAENTDMAFLPDRIMAAVQATRRMQELSEAMVGTMQDVAKEEDRYQLMKLLADPVDLPGASTAAPETQEIQALQILDAFAALGDTHTSPGETLAQTLEDGDFSSFVAEDILANAEAENSDLNPSAQREARNLLELSRRLLGEASDPEVIAHLVAAETLELWPASTAKAVDMWQADYLSNLVAIRGDYRGYLAAYRCLPPAVTANENLTHIAEDLLLETAKTRSKDTASPMPQRLKAKTVAERIEKRKRRRPPSEPSALDAPLDRDSKPEVAAVRRDLVYIKPDGTQAPEGSDECDKIFDDYLAEHRDQTGLEEDLERIREYLKTMDLTKGTPRGIKTLGRGQSLKRGDSEFSKVYQLKPKDAVGLSTSSNRGEKIRVLFVMENNTVGILGIADRDETPALMRKVGVRGRNRRK